MKWNYISTIVGGIILTLEGYLLHTFLLDKDWLWIIVAEAVIVLWIVILFLNMKSSYLQGRLKGLNDVERILKDNLK